VLLPAMDERQIIIPKIGVVKAKPGFLIIATQNPEEFVGTSRLSEALKDRFVWIHLDYQSEIEEMKIVEKETGCDNDDVVATAVKITRRTREITEIRRGASIRGAIDITDLIAGREPRALFPDLNTWVRTAVMALSTRIELQDQTTHRMEDVIEKVVMDILNDYSKRMGGQLDNSSQEDESGIKKKSLKISES